MIDRLHEIGFNPDGKGYALISLAKGNPYVLEEVQISGVIRPGEHQALLVQEVEIEGRMGKVLHPVKVAGEQASGWLSSKIPLIQEIRPTAVSSPDISHKLIIAERELRRFVGDSFTIHIRSYGSPQILERD